MVDQAQQSTAVPNDKGFRFVMATETRWAYVVTAVGALLFVGHAWEDAGLVGAGPYALVALVSLVSIVRPTRIAWFVLSVLYLAYLGVVMSVVLRAPFAEWLVFFLVGSLPCAALWWARPRKVRVVGDPLEERRRPTRG